MKKEGHLPCRLVDFPRRDKEQTDFFFVVSYSASSLENRQTFKREKTEMQSFQLLPAINRAIH